MSVQSGSGFNTKAAPDVTQEDVGILVHVRDIWRSPMMFTPDGQTEPRPVTARLAGTYSKRYRRVLDAQARRASARAQEGIGGFDPDVARKNRQELVAACVLEWEGFHEDGKELACTPENVEAILEIAPYIREQFETAMADHERFFSRPSAS